MNWPSKQAFRARFWQSDSCSSLELHMQYLAKWRMQIAAELLTGSNVNVGTIAAQIGYESEAAFSRAFKKMIGVPPSAWRRTILEDRAAGPG